MTTTDRDKLIKRYLIDHISADGYEAEPTTQQQLIDFAQKTFMSELGWSVEQVGRQAAVKDWLQGLASALTVDFYNGEIIELGQQWGYLNADSTEAQQDKFCDQYWTILAGKLCQIFDGHRVPKQEGAL